MAIPVWEQTSRVAAAGKLALTPEGRVAVAAWFCPATVANLQKNRRVSLVIWDPKVDTGYQLRN